MNSAEKYNEPENWTEGKNEDLDHNYKMAETYVDYYLPEVGDGLRLAAMGVLNDKREDLENPNLRQEIIERLQLSDNDVIKFDEFVNQLKIDRGWSNEEVSGAVQEEVNENKIESYEDFDFSAFEEDLVNFLRTLEMSDLDRTEKAGSLLTYLKDKAFTENGKQFLPTIKRDGSIGRLSISNLEEEILDVSKDSEVGRYSDPASRRIGRLPTSGSDISNNEPYNDLLDRVFNT